MMLVQPFKMAVKSIWSNKTRSFLTMLGTIIGVGSVIALLSIGQGATNSITDAISSAGTNMLSVTITGRGSKTMEADEMVDFVEQNSELYASVAPVTSSSGLIIKYGNKNTDTTSLTGTNHSYADISSVEVTRGRYLSQLDVENRRRVAVIGSYLQQELFDGADPLGEQIKINGTPFTVIGVLEEKQDSGQSTSDDAVVIPYTVATRLLKNSVVRSYVIQGANEDVLELAKTELKSFLYKKFRSTDAYMIIDQKELMDAMDEAMSTMTGLLGGIAGISLLVAGIGIMNIMLVSVTERTREIGIRKAIGAKRRHILTQFLIESLVISSIGGVIGILAGVGLGSWLGGLMGITAIPNADVIIMSFSFSLIMGLFFGYYPANKASKLNPIEALRFE